MKTTIDTDLAIDASKEAKICLNCDKKKCFPDNCKRFKQSLKNMKQGETNEKG